MTENQRCGDCTHFLVDSKKGEQGQCRCDPPQVVVTSEPQSRPVMQNHKLLRTEVTVRHKMQPIFPPMFVVDRGCGQYSPKYEEAPDLDSF